jgi:hypothetical protein
VGLRRVHRADRLSDGKESCFRLLYYINQVLM